MSRAVAGQGNLKICRCWCCCCRAETVLRACYSSNLPCKPSAYLPSHRRRLDCNSRVRLSSPHGVHHPKRGFFPAVRCRTDASCLNLAPAKRRISLSKHKAFTDPFYVCYHFTPNGIWTAAAEPLCTAYIPSGVHSRNAQKRLPGRPFPSLGPLLAATGDHLLPPAYNWCRHRRRLAAHPPPPAAARLGLRVTTLRRILPLGVRVSLTPKPLISSTHQQTNTACTGECYCAFAASCVVAVVVVVLPPAVNAAPLLTTHTLSTHKHAPSSPPHCPSPRLVPVTYLFNIATWPPSTLFSPSLSQHIDLVVVVTLFFLRV